MTPVVKKEQKVFFHYMEQSPISQLFAVVCSNFHAEFKKYTFLPLKNMVAFLAEKKILQSS